MPFSANIFNSHSLSILLDSNILLNAIKDNWHIHSLVENQIFQSYKIFVPDLIIKEIKRLNIKQTVKKGAIRLATEIFDPLIDADILSDSDYRLSIDDQLLQLAINLNKENYTILIMTQDIKFKEKILKKSVPVLLVSYGRSKLIKPK